MSFSWSGSITIVSLYGEILTLIGVGVNVSIDVDWVSERLALREVGVQFVHCGGCRWIHLLDEVSRLVQSASLGRSEVVQSSSGLHLLLHSLTSDLSQVSSVVQRTIHVVQLLCLGLGLDPRGSLLGVCAGSLLCWDRFLARDELNVSLNWLVQLKRRLLSRYCIHERLCSLLVDSGWGLIP